MISSTPTNTPQLDMTPELGAEIIRLARECLGTPFRHQGRVPGRALDCVGLIRYPAVALGLVRADFDVNGYGCVPVPRTMGEHLLSHLELINHNIVKPGDLIWLKAPEAQHLAIYAGETMIHATRSGPGRVVEHPYKAPFTGRTVAWFRYKRID